MKRFFILGLLVFTSLFGVSFQSIHEGSTAQNGFFMQFSEAKSQYVTRIKTLTLPSGASSHTAGGDWCSNSYSGAKLFLIPGDSASIKIEPLTSAGQRGSIKAFIHVGKLWEKDVTTTAVMDMTTATSTSSTSINSYCGGGTYKLNITNPRTIQSFSEISSQCAGKWMYLIFSQNEDSEVNPATGRTSKVKITYGFKTKNKQETEDWEQNKGQWSDHRGYEGVGGSGGTSTDQQEPIGSLNLTYPKCTGTPSQSIHLTGEDREDIVPDFPYSNETLTPTEENSPETAPIVPTRTYKDATDDVNLSKWNTSDYLKNVNKHYSLKGGLIGNAQMRLQNMGYNLDSEDANDLTTGSTPSATATDNNATGAFSESLYNKMKSNSESNVKVALNNEDAQIKCYIARSLRFQYECPLNPGIYYGASNLDIDGRVAKATCNAECYSSSSKCRDIPSFSGKEVARPNHNIVGGPGASPIEYDLVKPGDFKYASFSLEDDINAEFMEIIMNIKNIDPNDKVPVKKKKFFIDVNYQKSDGTKHSLIERAYVGEEYGLTKKVYIRNNIKKVQLKFYTEDLNATDSNITDSNITVELKELKFSFEAKEKWVCNRLQDLSYIDLGTFSKKCDSGNIISYTDSSGNVVQVCNEEKYRVGDNMDGTFSKENECNTYCRQQAECVPRNTTTLYNNALATHDNVQDFNEGCMDTSNCQADSCQAARLANAPIIEETVYNADYTPRKTVTDGVEIPGSNRPRILRTRTADPEENNVLEWKDLAYEAMLIRNTYNSSGKLKSDTKVMYGYKKTQTGGSSSIDWKIKPKAFEIYNGVTYKAYSVLVIDFEYLNDGVNAETKSIRDRVFYVRTSNPGSTDYWKPFYRAEEWGGVSINADGVNSVVKYDTSLFLYQTFSLNSWINLSETANAEYFTTLELDDPKIYIVNVLNSTKTMRNGLPGMLRRREIVNRGTDLQYTQNYYNGNFDGTGMAIAKYDIYAGYFDSDKTYSQLVDYIKNGSNEKFKKIYTTERDPSIPMNIGHDSYNQDSENPVQMLRFGPVSKTTIDLKIYPKDEDIGKKGFVYVFVK